MAGTVSDPNGAVVAGATVTPVDTQLQLPVKGLRSSGRLKYRCVLALTYVSMSLSRLEKPSKP